MLADKIKSTSQTNTNTTSNSKDKKTAVAKNNNADSETQENSNTLSSRYQGSENSTNQSSNNSNKDQESNKNELKIAIPIDTILLTVSIACLFFFISTIYCLIAIKCKNHSNKDKVYAMVPACIEETTKQKSQSNNQNRIPEQVINIQSSTPLPEKNKTKPPHSVIEENTKLGKTLQTPEVEDNIESKHLKDVENLEIYNKKLHRALTDNDFCYNDLFSQIENLIESNNNKNVQITHYHNKSRFSHTDDRNLSFDLNNLTKDSRDKVSKHTELLENLKTLIGNLNSGKRAEEDNISSLIRENDQLKKDLDDTNKDIQDEQKKLDTQDIELRTIKIENERLKGELELLLPLVEKYENIKKDKTQLEEQLSISQSSSKQIEEDKENSIKIYEDKIRQIEIIHSNSFVEECLQRHEMILTQIKEELETLNIANDYNNYLGSLDKVNFKDIRTFIDYLNNVNRIRLISLYKDSKINSLYPIINILFEDLISVAEKIHNLYFLYPKRTPQMLNDELITKPDGTLLRDNISFESKKYSILRKVEPELFMKIYESLDNGSIYEVETMCVYDHERIYTNLTIYVKQ